MYEHVVLGFYSGLLRCKTKPPDIIPCYPCVVSVTAPLPCSLFIHTSATSTSIEQTDVPSEDPQAAFNTFIL